MSAFQAEKKLEGDQLIFEIKGSIDEDSNFDSLQADSGSQLVIDMDGIDAINSCGIREWIKWIQQASGYSQIIYKNCPKVIVDQINMVAGFLPGNGKVESFYVPYYCEETDNEKMILFREGQEFTGGEVNPPEDVKDDESGDEMEMDVIEGKYFKFLSK